MERVVLVYISILEIFKNCTVQTSYVLISMCKIVRIHEKHCGNFFTKYARKMERTVDNC